MTKQTSTPFSNRCQILADFYIAYKGDEDFADFFQYNDLGLPIAYAISSEIVKSTPKTEAFINETFDLLLAGLELDDTGFEELDDILPSGDYLAEPF
jgi:hypothetical protein